MYMYVYIYIYIYHSPQSLTISNLGWFRRAPQGGGTNGGGANVYPPRVLEETECYHGNVDPFRERQFNPPGATQELHPTRAPLGPTWG